MNLDFSAITPSIPYILKGLEVTLKIVAVSALIGFILGTLLALCKIARIRVLNVAADLYTSIFRGTPLVLQLMIIYFGVPQMIGYDIPAFLAAVIAFSLNSGAYMSEVIRAGIQAIDKGQTEAAIALGVPYGKMMRHIILPQALKNILPALVNEFATLTKESAVVTVIGATDLMRRAYIVGGETFKYLEPLLFVGLVYYILVIVLTVVGKAIEGRMKKSD
ncbi:amino acid ABC transporter permease [Bacillus cytotoxicus]|uniref:Polar amino acid ABC transporter, inner membrane subunit n=2 Tax=Bacillus cytotoxicus TaxID=580165 RepID=A0AAX2CK03_9BACI|nr:MULTISPECIES: amino acid ABC transporter permease [Bacillus cereus group]ABS23081.1 polar amino acid ABC transporter, inner membrane subunit [Bacillus cytotoxicus NVH 391-98]AWC29732.1 amino acid ABC transporter permease [Bacillus cytotoxicus]AWC33737.1 amino acid ABC transporter permease [Bacillus cytotoxicus]AWC37716.1 amino acid ABC transporter permease [Bacillus cytotoxicus]AWC41863.1 amino acid ABC transporter permease [Bacillus cytotoxicus]